MIEKRIRIAVDSDDVMKQLRRQLIVDNSGSENPRRFLHRTFLESVP